MFIRYLFCDQNALHERLTATLVRIPRWGELLLPAAWNAILLLIKIGHLRWTSGSVMSSKLIGIHHWINDW